MHDVWIDDVFYDLAFDARLDGRTGTSTSAQALPPCTATAIGIVSHLEGAARHANGTPVAEIRIEEQEGRRGQSLVRAGRDTAEG